MHALGREKGKEGRKVSQVDLPPTSSALLLLPWEQKILAYASNENNMGSNDASWCEGLIVFYILSAHQYDLFLSFLTCKSIYWKLQMQVL